MKFDVSKGYVAPINVADLAKSKQLDQLLCMAKGSLEQEMKDKSNQNKMRPSKIEEQVLNKKEYKYCGNKEDVNDHNDKMSKKIELKSADNKHEDMVKDELKSNSKIIDKDNYDTPAIITNCEKITNSKETATEMQSNEQQSNDNNYSCDLKGTSKADINTQNIKQQAKVISTKKE